jgi:hypothetical protein
VAPMRLLTVAGATVLLALSACQSGPMAPPPPPPGTTGAGTGTGVATGSRPPPGTTGGRVVVDEQQNRSNVRLTVGQRLEFDLHNLYWTVQGSPTPRLLSQDGPTQQVLPSPGACPPGVGCGLLRTTFTAHQTGTVTLTASRTTCGEALRCTGDQGSYRITVVITR